MAGEAQPLNGVTVDDEHRQRDIKNTVPEDKALGVGHDGSLARIEEQADEQLIGHAQDEEGRNAIHTANAQGGVHAAIHTAKVFGAHILAGVGGHGGADALQRHAEELRRLAACSLRSHDVAAETIHSALQYHAADGRDAALQAHGDAHVAQLCAVGQAETALFPAPAQLRVVAHDVNKAADARHRLTEHGSKSRTECAHVEYDDAHKVKSDVQKACHQQEVQRTLAVAQSAHQRTGHIIKQGERDAPENGADVDIRKVDDVFRRIRPHQHRAGQCHRNDGEHHRKKDGQPHGIGGVTAHFLIILGTEGPGDRDGKTAGDAVHKAQHQIIQAAHTAHSRQRLHAHKTAHDDGIGQIVELLEQTAQHQRHRKRKDQLQRTALSHILCHSIKSSCHTGNRLNSMIFAVKNALPERGRTFCTFMNGIIAE